jgi:hypothetical protein
VHLNVLNIENEGAVIIYVDKWFAPIQVFIPTIDSEFFGDCETI